MFIVIYRPLVALMCETVFYGPYEEYTEAENMIEALPLACDCQAKYIQELISPQSAEAMAIMKAADDAAARRAARVRERNSRARR